VEPPRSTPPRAAAAPDPVPHHEEWGAGEPVLLLHGGYASIETMRDLGDLLAAHLRVLAVERPGHGRTADVEGPYDYAAMVAGTLAYLDALGVGPVHVVGHSDGGIIGLLLARDHPERVRSLVVVGANVSTDAWVQDDYPHVTVTDEAMALVEAEYARLSPDGPEHLAVVEAKLMALWTTQPDIPLASLAGVRAPVLVLAGEHDVVAREHTEQIAAAIDGARLTVVAGTTHMVVRERPDVVAAQVLALVAEARGPGEGSTPA
jgi:pimeloyl-ACP methyl ester carboxylesterase